MVQKKLNIAIFTDSFTPLINGVVTSTLNLANGLAERGHTVHIIAPYYFRHKDRLHPNIKVKRIFGVPALFYEGFKFTSILSVRVLWYLRKQNIDVIHFQTPASLGIQ